MIGIKSWDLLGGSSHGSGKLRLRIVSPHSAGVIPSKKMEFMGEWNKILGNLEAFFFIGHATLWEMDISINYGI